MLTLNDLNKFYDDVINDCKRLNIPVDEKRIIGKISLMNARGAVGKCHRKCGLYYIKFSSFYLGFDERHAKDIIMHEVIHTLKDCFNHKYEFKKWMNFVNRNGYHVHVKLNDDYEAKEFAKQHCKEAYIKKNKPQRQDNEKIYKIQCPCCKDIISFSSSTASAYLNPENYTCTKCNSTLARIDNIEKQVAIANIVIEKKVVRNASDERLFNLKQNEKLSNKQMIPVIKLAVDKNDINTLMILKTNHKDIFMSSLKYIGTKRNECVKSLMTSNKI